MTERSDDGAERTMTDGIDTNIPPSGPAGRPCLPLR